MAEEGFDNSIMLDDNDDDGNANEDGWEKLMGKDLLLKVSFFLFIRRNSNS